MTADHRFKLLFANILALRDDLITNHDGRSHRQSKLCMLLALIGFSSLGDDLDFNPILFSHPGNHLAEMASGFPTGIVLENPDFQHVHLPHYINRLTVGISLIPLLVSKEPVQDSLPLRLRFWKAEEAANGSFQLVFIDIATLHHQFIPDHDGRRHWQPQFGVFLGAIFLKRFGGSLDLQSVFFPQPGDNLSKMPSGFAAGLV